MQPLLLLAATALLVGNCWAQYGSAVELRRLECGNSLLRMTLIPDDNAPTFFLADLPITEAQCVPLRFLAEWIDETDNVGFLDPVTNKAWDYMDYTGAYASLLNLSGLDNHLINMGCSRSTDRHSFQLVEYPGAPAKGLLDRVHSSACPVLYGGVAAVPFVITRSLPDVTTPRNYSTVFTSVELPIAQFIGSDYGRGCDKTSTTTTAQPLFEEEEDDDFLSSEFSDLDCALALVFSSINIVNDDSRSSAVHVTAALVSLMSLLFGVAVL